METTKKRLHKTETNRINDFSSDDMDPLCSSNNDNDNSWNSDDIKGIKETGNYFEPLWPKRNSLSHSQLDLFLPQPLTSLILFRSWARSCRKTGSVLNPFFSMAELSLLQQILQFMVTHEQQCFCDQPSVCPRCFIYPKCVTDLTLRLDGITRIESKTAPYSRISLCVVGLFVCDSFDFSPVALFFFFQGLSCFVFFGIIIPIVFFFCWGLFY